MNASPESELKPVGQPSGNHLCHPGSPPAKPLAGWQHRLLMLRRSVIMFRLDVVSILLWVGVLWLASQVFQATHGIAL